MGDGTDYGRMNHCSRGEHSYIRVPGVCLCSSLSANRYFMVRVRSACCVICTLPHLGILLFFIRLFMLISILSCVSYASNFLWAFNFNFFLKFSAGRASTCLSSVYRVVLRTWLFPVYIPYSLATQDVQTVGTTKKRRNNFKCKKFWYQPKKKSAGLHFAFEVV